MRQSSPKCSARMSRSFSGSPLRSRRLPHLVDVGLRPPGVVVVVVEVDGLDRLRRRRCLGRFVLSPLA